MARKYKKFRRYRKARWASNIKEISLDNISLQPATFSITQTLAQNPAQQDNLVSQTFTIKNIEASFVFEGKFGAATGYDNIENITAYLMYVPQGYASSTDLPNDFNNLHPEWIMNYKFIGSPSGDENQGYQPVKFKTRLSRRLQTGDRIVLFIKGFNKNSTAVSSYELHGLIRWWTKAN